MLHRVFVATVIYWVAWTGLTSGARAETGRFAVYRWKAVRGALYYGCRYRIGNRIYKFRSRGLSARLPAGLEVEVRAISSEHTWLRTEIALGQEIDVAVPPSKQAEVSTAPAPATEAQVSEPAIVTEPTELAPRQEDLPTAPVDEPKSPAVPFNPEFVAGFALGLGQEHLDLTGGLVEIDNTSLIGRSAARLAYVFDRDGQVPAFAVLDASAHNYVIVVDQISAGKEQRLRHMAADFMIGYWPPENKIARWAWDVGAGWMYRQLPILTFNEADLQKNDFGSAKAGAFGLHGQLGMRTTEQVQLFLELRQSIPIGSFKKLSVRAIRFGGEIHLMPHLDLVAGVGRESQKYRATQNCHLIATCDRNTHSTLDLMMANLGAQYRF